MATQQKKTMMRCAFVVCFPPVHENRERGEWKNTPRTLFLYADVFTISLSDSIISEEIACATKRILPNLRHWKRTPADSQHT